MQYYTGLTSPVRGGYGGPPSKVTQQSSQDTPSITPPASTATSTARKGAPSPGRAGSESSPTAAAAVPARKKGERGVRVRQRMPISPPTRPAHGPTVAAFCKPQRDDDTEYPVGVDFSTAPGAVTMEAMCAHRVADTTANEWLLRESCATQKSLAAREKNRHRRSRQLSAAALERSCVRAVLNACFGKLARWTHYQTWARFMNPRYGKAQTKRSIVPSAQPPPPAFPEDLVSKDFLRRQVQQERQKNKSLRRLNSTLETTLCDLKRAPTESLVSANELQPKSLPVEGDLAGDGTPTSAVSTSHTHEASADTGTADYAELPLKDSVDAVTAELYGMLQSIAPDCDEVCDCLKQVTSQAYWYQLNACFRKRYRAFHDGNLKRALQATFVSREFDMLHDMLLRSDVKFDLDTKEEEDDASRSKTPPRQAVPRGRSLQRMGSSVSVPKGAHKAEEKGKKKSTHRTRAKSAGVSEGGRGAPLRLRGQRRYISPPRPCDERRAVPVQDSEFVERHGSASLSISNIKSVVSVEGTDPPSPRKAPVLEGSARRDGQESRHRSPSASPPRPVQFVDSDGDLLSFTTCFAGIVYSVNGVKRPPSRCIVVSEAERRIDFPDIAKAVVLPEETHLRHDVLLRLRELALKSGIGHNILKAY